MTEVDERLVAMHFDSKGFEKGAKDTIKMVEKLKDSLDFEGSTESLEELNDAVKMLAFDDAAEKSEKLHKSLTAVEKIMHKTFSVATFPFKGISNALGSLANDVRKWFGIDLARDIEQSIKAALQGATIGPVKEGFDKYTEEVNNVASLLYAVKDKYYSGDDVKATKAVYETLEKLSEYSDATSYSYSQMTTAMTTFVSNGVKMEDAELAIEGVANAAAKAGVSIRDGQIAFRNWADAMSKGKLLKEDWRSLENIKMTTEELRKELIAAAIEEKTLDEKGRVKKGKKKVVVTEENFAEMLQTGFVTKDVMKRVLKKYADQTSDFGREAYEAAQKSRTFTDAIDSIKDALSSGWRKSFRYIFGDMGEATTLWSDLADRIIDTFDKVSEARNNFLHMWRGKTFDNEGREISTGDEDGRQHLIDSLHNILDIFEQIGNIATKAWRQVFGDFNYKDLLKITGGISAFTEKIKDGLGSLGDPSSRASKLVNVLKGLFSIIKKIAKVIKTVVSTAVKFVIPILDPMLDFFSTLGSTISDLFEGKISLGSFIDAFGSSFSQMFDSIKIYFKQTWEKLKTWFKGLFSKGGVFEPVGTFLNNARVIIVQAIEDFKKFVHWDDIVSGITNFISTVEGWSGWTALSDFFNNNIISPIKTIFEKDDNGTSLFSTWWSNLNSKVTDFKKTVEDWAIWKALSDFFSNSIIGPIKTFFEKDENGTSHFTTWWNNFRTTIDGFKTAITEWIGWKVLSDFFSNNIIGPIKSFFAKKEDGTSEFTTWWNNFKNAIDGFKDTVAGWGIWKALSTFFSDNIIGPIKSFFEKDDNGTSRFTTWWSNLSSKINDFKTTVEGWGIWKALSDFFSNSIIGPIKTFFEKDDNGTSHFTTWWSNLRTKINDFKTTVEGWGIWKALSTFFSDKIIGPIKSFFAKKEDGTSEFTTWWNNFKNAIDGFKDTVVGWGIWKALSTFFSDKIIGPIKSFFEKDDNGTSHFTTWWSNLKTNIGNFKTTVEEWEGWDKLWSFFNDHIIGPLRKLYNWLFHGDPDYDPKKVGAHNPIATVAGAMVSDRPLFKREGTDTTTTIDEITNNLSESLTALANTPDQAFEGKNLEEGPFAKAMAWLSTTASSLDSIASSVRSTIDSVMDWLVNENWDEDFNKILEKLERFAGIFATVGGGDALMGLGSFFSGAGGLFNTIKKNGGVFKFDFFGSLFGGKNTDKSLSGLINELSKQVKKEGLVNVLKSLAKGGSEVKEASRTASERAKTVADILIELGGSIALMAFAINSLLDKIKEIESLPEAQKDKIWQDFKMIMTGIASSLGVTELIALASSVWGHAKVNTVGNTLIGLAVAVEGIVLAISHIADLSAQKKDLSGAVEVLGSIATIIGVFVGLTSGDIGGTFGGALTAHIAWGQKSSQLGTLVGFAVAIRELIHEVVRIAEMPEIEYIGGGQAIKKADKLQTAIDVLDAISGLVGRFVAVANGTTSEISASDKKGKKGIFEAIVSLGKNKSAGLIGFATAMFSILSQVEKLSNIGKVKLDRAVEAINAIGEMVSKFVEIANLTTTEAGVSFGKFDLNLSGGRNKSAGLLGFMAAMWVLTDQVVKIGKEATEDQVKQGLNVVKELVDALKGFVVFKELGSLLSGSITFGEKASFKGGKSGGGLLGFMAAMLEMLIAVSAFGKMKDTEVEQGLNVIKAITAMIDSFQFLKDVETGLDAFSSTGEKLAGLFAPAVFAGSILLILHGVTEMAKLDKPQLDNALTVLDKVKEVLTAMAEGLVGSGIFGAVGALAGKDPGHTFLGMLVVIGGLVAGLAIVGAAAAGLGALYNTWPNLPELIQNGTKVATAIGEFIGEFVGAIGGKLIATSDKEINTGKTEENMHDIKTIAEACSDITSEELDQVVAVVTKMKEISLQLRGFDPNIFGQIFNGDITIGKFADYMTGLGQGLNNFATQLNSATFDQQKFDSALLFFGALLDLSDDMRTSKTDNLVALLTSLERLSNDYVWDAKTQQEISLNWSHLIELFTTLGEKIGQGIKRGAADVTAQPIIDMIVDSIKKGGDQIRAAVAEAVRSGLTLSGTETPETKPSETQNVVNSVVDPLKDGAEKALEALGGAVQGKAEKIQEVGLAALNQYGSDASEIIVEALTTGDYQTAATKFAALGGDSGIAMVNGLTNAILGNTSDPTDATNTMATAIDDTFKEAQDINSPSRVFYAFGKYLDEGLANGIRENTLLAVESIRALGYQCRIAMLEVALSIADMINNQMDQQMTITPVVDMSKANEGANAINRMFGNRYAMVPSFARNVNTPDVRANMNAQQIIRAINSVNERLNQLNSNVSRMQIVLDTGVLVGQTVAAYDRALGARAARFYRG